MNVLTIKADSFTIQQRKMRRDCSVAFPKVQLLWFLVFYGQYQSTLVQGRNSGLCNSERQALWSIAEEMYAVSTGLAGGHNIMLY